MAATIELLDRRRLQNVLDAIVAVNDDVALGAIDELNRRGSESRFRSGTKRSCEAWNHWAIASS